MSADAFSPDVTKMVTAHIAYNNQVAPRAIEGKKLIVAAWVSGAGKNKLRQLLREIIDGIDEVQIVKATREQVRQEIMALYGPRFDIKHIQSFSEDYFRPPF